MTDQLVSYADAKSRFDALGWEMKVLPNGVLQFIPGLSSPVPATYNIPSRAMKLTDMAFTESSIAWLESEKALIDAGKKDMTLSVTPERIQAFRDANPEICIEDQS